MMKMIIFIAHVATFFRHTVIFNAHLMFYKLSLFILYLFVYKLTSFFIVRRSFNLYFSRKYIQNSLIFPPISFSKSINSSSTNTSRHGTDVLHAIHVWPLAAPKVNDTWKKMMMYDLHTNRVVIDDRKFRNRIWNWIR